MQFWLKAFLLAALGAAGAAGRAQTTTPAPAPMDVSADVEFQQIVSEYLRLPKLPAGTVDPDVIQSWERETLEQTEALMRRLENLKPRIGESPDLLLIYALCYVKHANVLLAQRRQLDAQARIEPTPELQRRRTELAEQVAFEFQRVDRLLKASLDAADTDLRTGDEWNLVRGVVQAQSAIVQARAVDLVGDRPRVKFERENLRDLLDNAADLLAEYLNETPPEAGLAYVRGKFYLAVVNYRRSLLPPYETESGRHASEVDASRMSIFEEARSAFEDLSDPERVQAALGVSEGGGRETPADVAYNNSSFRLDSEYSPEAVAHFYAASANLYLGIMAAVMPGTEPAEKLAAAEPYLNRAKTFDFHPRQPGSDPTSLTKQTVPFAADEIANKLQQAAQQTGVRQPLNDLTLSMGMGIAYDSNVPLLGRNTATPLERDRKRDFRFNTGFRLDYIADLDAFKPGDEALRKWQINVQAAATPTWNARISEFNEQIYDASVNIRYELVGGDQIPNIDGIFLNARYDYSYVLLENDGFLRIHRFRPSVQVVAFEELLTSTTYFSYDDRNYLETLIDDRFDRDGNYFVLGTELRWNFNRWGWNAERFWGRENAWGPLGPREDDVINYERPVEFSVGLEGTTNSTQGQEFDYSSEVLTAGLRFPFPLGVDFVFTSLWEWQDYRGESLIDRSRRGRNDFIQDYSFRAERRFFLTQDYPSDFENIEPLRLRRVVMTLFGDIRFTIDDSNVRDRLGQSIFEYNRIVYGAGVRFDID